MGALEMWVTVNEGRSLPLDAVSRTAIERALLRASENDVSAAVRAAVAQGWCLAEVLKDRSAIKKAALSAPWARPAASKRSAGAGLVMLGDGAHAIDFAEGQMRLLSLADGHAGLLMPHDLRQVMQWTREYAGPGSDAAAPRESDTLSLRRMRERVRADVGRTRELGDAWRRAL